MTSGEFVIASTESKGIRNRIIKYIQKTVLNIFSSKMNSDDVIKLLTDEQKNTLILNNNFYGAGRGRGMGPCGAGYGPGRGRGRGMGQGSGYGVRGVW